MTDLKVFTCNDHDGFYPVGVASVIVAQTEEEAAELLKVELRKRELGTDDFTLIELDMSISRAVVLQDGNY